MSELPTSYDPTVLHELLVRAAAKVVSDTNALLKANYLIQDADWQVNDARSLHQWGPRPQPPLAYHLEVIGLEWFPNWGPDRVADQSPLPQAGTDVGAVGGPVGGPVPGQPGHFYIKAELSGEDLVALNRGWWRNPATGIVYVLKLISFANRVWEATT